MPTPLIEEPLKFIAHMGSACIFYIISELGQEPGLADSHHFMTKYTSGSKFDFHLSSSGLCGRGTATGGRSK